MTRHILILDYLHVYNDQRMLLQAEALAAEGFDVRVLGTARFGEHAFHDRRNGVDFYLLPLVATFNPFLILQAFLRWLRADPRNVIGLPADTPRRGNPVSILFYWLWVLRLGWSGTIDSITAHEHIPLPVGWLLARLKQVPLVYDEHDYIGAIGYYEGRKGNIAAKVEAFFLKRVDAATTVGERLASVLKGYGVQHTVVIGNWKRLDDYKLPASRISEVRNQYQSTSTRLIISYLSTFGPSRYIPELLEAIRTSPDVILLIGGGGNETYEQIIRQAAQTTPNLYFLGWIKREEIPLYTCISDVVYHCLDAREDPQMTFAAPNKLFEAFAAGKPVLAKDGTGEMSDILQLEQAGLLLEEVTPATLCQAFEKLCDPVIRGQLAANALRAANHYNWDEIRRRLAELYNSILSERPNLA